MSTKLKTIRYENAFMSQLINEDIGVVHSSINQLVIGLKVTSDLPPNFILFYSALFSYVTN